MQPWGWYGFIGGLLVGVFLQDQALQQDLWYALPHHARLAWWAISVTLARLAPNSVLLPVLLFGTFGAMGGLILFFLFARENYT